MAHDMKPLAKNLCTFRSACFYPKPRPKLRRFRTWTKPTSLWLLLPRQNMHTAITTTKRAEGIVR